MRRKRPTPEELKARRELFGSLGFDPQNLPTEGPELHRLLDAVSEHRKESAQAAQSQPPAI